MKGVSCGSKVLPAFFLWIVGIVGIVGFVGFVGLIRLIGTFKS